MNAAPAPKITRHRGFPLIWIVPIVALIVAGWMLLRNVGNYGPDIVIEFADGSGIEPGKTALEYNGVTVGMVKDLSLTKDLSRVEVRVQLRREAAGLARQGAQFWVVHPEFSFSGVRGLETLVRGVRLGVHAGNGPPARHFRGLDSAPPPLQPALGRAFYLRTDQLGGLSSGTPVYYRGVKIGTAEATRLTDDATNVLIRVRIFTPYVNLVRKNSKFWNANFSVKGGLLSGFEFKNISIESLVSGGIGLSTPDGDLAPPADDGTEFPLASEQDKDWEKWQPKIPIMPKEQGPEANPRPAPAVLKP